MATEVERGHSSIQMKLTFLEIHLHHVQNKELLHRKCMSRVSFIYYFTVCVVLFFTRCTYLVLGKTFESEEKCHLSNLTLTK